MFYYVLNTIMLISTVLKLITEANGKTKAKSSKSKEKSPLLDNNEIADVVMRVINAASKNVKLGDAEENAEEPTETTAFTNNDENSFINSVNIISKSSKIKPIVNVRAYLNCKPNDRIKFIQSINKYTSTKNKNKKVPVDLVDTNNAKGYKLACFKFKDNIIKLELKAGQPKELNADTHELMTAALCLSTKINTKYVLKTKDYNKLLAEIYKLAASENIIGKADKDFQRFICIL